MSSTKVREFFFNKYPVWDFQTRQTLALTQHYCTTESKRIKFKLLIKRLKGIAENNKR